jgi:putative spermidine/putrescine transport system substrate-binding protein
VPTSGFTGTLRVVGLGVDLIDPIKELGEARLGFKLDFKVVGTTDMEQIVLTQPGSFDVFAGYQHQPDKLWASGNLQPVDRSKIIYWDQIVNVFKLGKLDPASTTCTVGDGDAPFRALYIDPDKTGTWPSSAEAPPEMDGIFIQWVDEATGQTVGDEPPLIKGVPQNFNMDSVGYNGDVIQLEPAEVGWKELFNESYSGRVALLGDPAIALQDAGNAAKELGLMEFGSTGNMTQQEMDGLFAILTDLKKKGQFRAFWATFDESVNLMLNDEVVIESMWSPAVYLCIAQGKNVRYAAPAGGYRGWAAQQAIGSQVSDPAVLGAAYDYMNWWLSGEPATLMMNQGYYNAAMGNLKNWVTPEEYDYWVLGAPAATDLAPVFGKVGDIKAGTTRDGGSLFERGCPYSSWNSFFTESEYQVSSWNDFQAA